MQAASSEPWHKTYRTYLVIFGGLVAAVAGYYVWSSYGYSFATSPLTDAETGKVNRDFQTWDKRRVAKHNELRALEMQNVDAANGWAGKANTLTEEWKGKVSAARTAHETTWGSGYWLGYKMKVPDKLPGMSSRTPDDKILDPNFKFTEDMAKHNFKVKFTDNFNQDKTQLAAIKEAYKAEKKSHDDFYGENSETWINGKNLDRAAGATAGLLAGAVVGASGLLGAGEEKKKSSSTTASTGNKKLPPRQVPSKKDKTKKGKTKTSGPKTDPKPKGEGEKSSGSGLIIFLIILACLAAAAAGVYIFCFMGKDEDFEDEELLPADDV